MNIKNIKNKIFNHINISKEESLHLFEKIMNGDFSDIELSAILIGLRMKGESKEEIIGAAQIMRQKSLKIKSPLRKDLTLFHEHSSVSPSFVKITWSKLIFNLLLIMR